MDNSMDVSGKIVLILGLGGYEKGSGVSAALFCLEQGAKKVIVTDAKEAGELTKTLRQLKGKRRVELVLGKHRLSDVRRAQLVVKNPGVPENIPAVRLAKKMKKTITNDIGLFLAHKPPGEVIAVTGTRGKSTTTSLIYEMLRQQYGNVFLGGNIGESPLQFVDKMQEGDMTVLELSSWLLHDLKKPHFDAAVVTNILPDHLDRYSSMDAYQRDKERIWKWQRADGLTILNNENARTRKMAKQVRSQVLMYGKGAGADGAIVRSGSFVVEGEQVAKVSDLKLLGEHNISNALAAVSVAYSFGVTNARIRSVLRTFTGVANRLEHVRTVGGVAYYNDTTATTPDAAVAALNSFDKKVILIAGGNTKGLSLAQFAKLISKKVKLLVLLEGNANAPLRRMLPKSRVHEVDNMKEAVQTAAGAAKKGDVVVLSPGCSWLPKMNEFERGARFVREVRKR
ncbi:UDP-N-acetylmuramoyl-L-alanine--D-glutamate ligase [Patescibacteria group bacterium]